MNNRLRVFVILLGALAVAAVFAFPLWRPFLSRTTTTVVFPGLNDEQQIAFLKLSDDQQQAFRDMRKADATLAVAMARGITSPDVVVPTEQQGMPLLTNPSVLAGGSFTTVDVLHSATGTATVYQTPDNKRVLRLEDFTVTNGPDLHVYLVRSPKPRKPEEVGNDYIDLGVLQGNVGNQNFEVPSEVDFSQYRGLIIYSAQYGVIFSSAEMRQS